MRVLFVVLATTARAWAGDMPPDSLWSDPAEFQCSPDVVGPADTIVLTKRSPALRELAVRRAGAKAPHVLVVNLPPEHMVPLMSSERLASTSELRITVSELVGLEWKAGASSEPVFTVPGTYRFLLSTSLESEEGAYYCSVRYQPFPTTN